jgi:hypothetical protein
MSIEQIANKYDLSMKELGLIQTQIARGDSSFGGILLRERPTGDAYENELEFRCKLYSQDKNKQARLHKKFDWSQVKVISKLPKEN